MFNYDKIRAVVIDTETNGLKPTDSVLACTTLELDIFINIEEMDIKMFATNMTVGYYNYRIDEPINPHALNVHQLTPERIKELRAKNRQSPTDQLYFEDVMGEVHTYLNSADLIIGHNLAFDLRMIHLPEPLTEVYCTMRNPHQAYKQWSEEPIKSSVSLARAADILKVDYNKASKHDATIDTFVTAKVFQEITMLDPSTVQDIHTRVCLK